MVANYFTKTWKSLSKKYLDAKEEIHRLTLEVQQLTQDNELININHEKHMEKMSKTFWESQHGMAELLSYVRKQKNEIDMCHTRFQNLVKKMGGASDKILSEKIAAYDLMAQNYEERIADYEEQLSIAAQERTTLHRKLTSQIEMLLQTQEGFTYGDTEEQKQDLLATVNRLKSQNSADKEMIKSLEVVNEQYETQLSEQKKKIETLISERSSMQKEISMMEKQSAIDADTIAAERLAKEAVLNHLEENIEAYQELEAAQDTIDKQDEMLERLEMKYKQQEAEFNRQALDALVAQKEVAKQEQHAEKLRQKAEDAAARADDLEKNASNIKDELTTLTQQLEEESGNYNEFTTAIRNKAYGDEGGLDFFFDAQANSNTIGGDRPTLNAQF